MVISLKDSQEGKGKHSFREESHGSNSYIATSSRCLVTLSQDSFSTLAQKWVKILWVIWQEMIKGLE